MDNDNDISLMKAEARGVVFRSYDDECEIKADNANSQLVKLLGWDAETRRKKYWSNYGFSYDAGTGKFCFMPPGEDEGAEADTLLGCIDAWLAERDPVRNAAIELRHQLRRAK